MFCVCYKKVNKVFWFKYWFYIGYVLIFLFMYDYICLYMLVIIDECLLDDWFFIVCGLNELEVLGYCGYYIYMILC